MDDECGRDRNADLDPWAVELDADLLAVTELIARHVHDAWMRRRLADGWTLGPQRDDVRREHPCLVEYDALSDADRDADRVTAMAAVRALVALGFEVRRRG
jgi:hypothetical protein